mgnify:CR=1 FL=1
MKKQIKINYILTLILVFCIGATIPTLIGSSQVNEQHSAKSEVPYCVTLTVKRLTSAATTAANEWTARYWLSLICTPPPCF